MLCALLFAALAGAACKKKQVAGRVAQSATDQPVSTAYAVKSAIAIQDAPSMRSKAIGTLPIGNRVDIFATRVPDQKDPEKVFWYKVRYAPLGAAGDKPAMPVEGFIPEREEVLRENFLVFEKRTEAISYKEDAAGKSVEVKEPLAVMATTSVNLRKTPALNGEKLRVLKNGEVLSVLEQSTRSVKTDGKYGAWFLLKDETGATGYAFGGFLLEGALPDMNALRDAGFQFTSGWLTPTGTDARIYTSATGTARIDLEKVYFVPEAWRASKGYLGQGQYLKVDGFTSKGGAPRYRFVQPTPDGPDQYYYVDKKKVKFIRDFYTVSKNEPHKFDEQLGADLNRFAGGDMNLQCSTTTEFSNGAPESPRRFLAIIAHFGPNDGDAEHCATDRRRIFITEVGEGNRVFYESPNGNGNFTDLDGDQIPELVSQDHRRGGWSVDIYALKPGKIVTILSLSGDGESLIGHAEVNDNLLVIYPEHNCMGDPKERDEKLCKQNVAAITAKYGIIKFDKKLPPFPYYGKLENGRFVQVPAKAES